MNYLVRFWNLVKGQSGEPFAVCPRHRDDMPVPSTCVVEELGRTDRPCAYCTDPQEGGA